MAERLPLQPPEHFPDKVFGSASVKLLYVLHANAQLTPPLVDGYPDFSQTFQLLPSTGKSLIEDDIASIRRELRILSRPPSEYWEEKADNVAQNMHEWHQKHQAQDKAEVFAAGFPARRTIEAVRYLSWYTHSLIEPNKAVKREAAAFRQGRLHGDLARLVAEGLVPPHTPRLVHEGLDRIKDFYAMDPFTSGYTQHMGEHHPIEHTIGISALVLGTDEMEPTCFHESIHAASDNGLCTILPGERVELTWLNEAYDEHLTQVVGKGEPYIIDPDKRKESGPAYVFERKLLSVMLQGLVQPPSLHDFSEAYFEPLEITSPARLRLKSLLNQTHPVSKENVLTASTMIAESYEKEGISVRRRNDLLRYWISRFTSR